MPEELKHSNSFDPELADQEEPVADELASLPYRFATQHGVLLLENKPEEITFLFKEPVEPFLYAELQRHARLPLRGKQISEKEFEQELAAHYQSQSSIDSDVIRSVGDDMDLSLLANSIPETEDLLEQDGDAPIIRLINAILNEAIKEQASDIHIETFEKTLVVRFRVDGIMRIVLEPKRQLAPLLVSRIKVMSKLDIAEKRVPQDGRISLKIAGRNVDVRVSTLPSSNGERIVMRLLDRTATKLDISHLGMSDHAAVDLRKLLHTPHGIILITGPTGSGKTTSLYAGLTELNDERRSILTVEDPIEYNLEGIGQTQVNTKTDMSFARGLRSILRQDPDVVMVGEIRDKETAEIAVQASLTGHLVLSTLHTNTAIGAITRLDDMGIEPFLLATSLIGIIAQRLGRRLCSHCKESYVANNAELKILSLSESEKPTTLYHAKGCEKCNHSGYRGRIGFYEIIVLNNDIRSLIHDHASEQTILEVVRRNSTSLRQDGISKVLAGLTTLEEVVRVSIEDT